MCIDLCVHMYICSNSMSIFVRVNWYCHFDDDMYVNLKELYKLLSQYDPSEPHYVGRNNRGPTGVKVWFRYINKVSEIQKQCTHIYHIKCSGYYCWKLIQLLFKGGHYLREAFILKCLTCGCYSIISFSWWRTSEFNHVSVFSIFFNR